MIDATCPNCGAAVHFRTPALPVKICDYCRTTLVRSGEVLQAMGKVAEVPEDVSPLQIGTRGKDGTGFELIGRIRMRWSGGGWNEWLALFDDGSTGWLSEAMGRFMLLRAMPYAGFRTDAVRQVRDDEPIALGAEATIDGVKYRVNDVKDATFAGSEGELPFSTPADTPIRSVDLMAPGGECASIQKDRGEVSVYAGRYVTLAEISATNLRAFDGWPLPSFAA